jgi:Putative prokaryotic signal transducing protein
MYYRDPKCVFVGDILGLAHAVVAHLSGHGIEAQVMNEMTLGGFEGLTAWLPGKASLRGLEVWVVNPNDAERARRIIAENDEELKRAQDSRSRRTDPVTAICEECGHSATFPPSEQGTVQDCPHCGQYIDVPDLESDPGNSDDGETSEPE